ncbi:hypothetical protein PT282_06210 [Bifidobacterium sp. ESL0763]|uniref:type II toxin-antitoxin system HicB family antitoxin n=1 Tax=Bifidobacterium sp. ESL0763 TaxID=2983227 RepID=UPI0023F6689F|nr:hypothetical protein [Bifidobacterium sp. ESL0763]MDF7664252.1 hypothetical protein [Bifidobacterium sp. ESL0763]
MRFRKNRRGIDAYGKPTVRHASYHVIVQPDERCWFITIPSLGEVGFTQARTLDEVDTMARDLIEIVTGDYDFALEQEMRFPEEVEAHLEAMQRYREQSKEANAAAARESRQAARGLRQIGLTLRQIGQALGISYQRAGQLVKG